MVRVDSGRDRLVRTADVVATDSGRSGRTDCGRDGQGDEGEGERGLGYIWGRETGSFVRTKRGAGTTTRMHYKMMRADRFVVGLVGQVA